MGRCHVGLGPCRHDVYVAINANISLACHVSVISSRELIYPVIGHKIAVVLGDGSYNSGALPVGCTEVVAPI
jgi:hypothetical protein